MGTRMIAADIRHSHNRGERSSVDHFFPTASNHSAPPMTKTRAIRKSVCQAHTNKLFSDFAMFSLQFLSESPTCEKTLVLAGNPAPVLPLAAIQLLYVLLRLGLAARTTDVKVVDTGCKPLQGNRVALPPGPQKLGRFRELGFNHGFPAPRIICPSCLSSAPARSGCGDVGIRT